MDKIECLQEKALHNTMIVCGLLVMIGIGG
jgi:hypothetical protein